jgi:hypothetical protein
MLHIVSARAETGGPSPARIGKTYGHKKLLELGTEVTELLVETLNFVQREMIGKVCWCMLAAS